MKLTTLTILSLAFLFVTVSVRCERSDHRCGPSYGNPGCSEGRCCSIHGWCGESATYCSGGNCRYQCWAVLSRNPLRTDNNNNNAVSIINIISESLFDEMFKHRKDCPSLGFYSYDAFVAAAASFPGFCSTGDVATRKRELAAFLAQTSQATAGQRSDSVDHEYAWGYCHINTTTTSGGVENDYCTSANWPCASGKKYNSRGPIQITHNHNYGLVGKALGIDLLNNPDLVATNPVISFKTAIWFWMTQHNNKLSSYDSVGYYKRYCHMLEVSYEDNLKSQYDETPNFLDVSRIRLPVF